jgi:flagellar basal-body rod modification protein FlgD
MIDTSNNVSSTASVLVSNGNSNKTSELEAQQDRFLKLLVAQLNNQDPMNPMDNAQMTSQMAQINTVTGITQLNETMKSMVSQFGAMQQMQGAAMIGREVLSAGNALNVTEGVGLGAVDLSANADQVVVQVLTPGGKVIDTVNVGAMKAGRNNFAIDTSAYQNTTGLSFKLVAMANNQAVAASTLQRDTVNAIGSDMSLSLKSGNTIKYDAVKAIL